MGMMVVSDEEFDRQVNTIAEKKEVKTGEVIDIKRGRGNVKEVEEDKRKIIAGLAIEGVKAKDLSEMFGVSQSSISAYKQGATSTSSYHEPDKELLESNNKKKLEISDKARKRLEEALDNITPDKLREANLKTVASVAKDMSAIVKNMEPERETEVNNTQFVFFAPPLKNESEYDVIHVNE